MATPTNDALKSRPQGTDTDVGDEGALQDSGSCSPESATAFDVVSADSSPSTESATSGSKEGQRRTPAAPAQLFKWKERKTTIDYDKTMTGCFKKCGRTSAASSGQMVVLGMPSKGRYASPKFTNSPAASSLPSPPEEWLRELRGSISKARPPADKPPR